MAVKHIQASMALVAMEVSTAVEVMVVEGIAEGVVVVDEVS